MEINFHNRFPNGQLYKVTLVSEIYSWRYLRKHPREFLMINRIPSSKGLNLIENLFGRLITIRNMVVKKKYPLEFPQKVCVRVRNLLISLEFSFEGCGLNPHPSGWATSFLSSEWNPLFLTCLPQAGQPAAGRANPIGDYRKP